MTARRGLLGIGLCVAGLTGGCYTEPIEPGWFSPPAQKALLFKPTDLGLEYEAIEVAAPAGYTLHGWFIPAPAAPATVLINHGAVFNRSALVPFYELIHNCGYHVVVYDYKGFGDSPGPADVGTLIPDADALLAYLATRPEPGAARIILFGISLGTLPTLARAADPPASVIGVIVDGSFDRESLPLWSASLAGATPAVNGITKIFDTHPELDPAQYIGRITLPKLFLQSPEDPITPLDGAQRLFALAPEPKRWCEVYGGHLFSSVLDANYAACVAAFLGEVTCGSATGD